MPRIDQTRGMIFEEVLLRLLSQSGYQVVTDVGKDKTLTQVSSGLAVRGRGGKHQIDAIADYSAQQPFSYPQRLLVEAKFYTSEKVGLPIVRNAVGVHKDVQEQWVASDGFGQIRNRYSYQYAIFSASGYTTVAEEYAYAQDVYLIQLASSLHFRPIIKAIGAIEQNDFQWAPGQPVPLDLKSFRRELRSALLYDGGFNMDLPERAMEKIWTLLKTVADHRNRSALGLIAGSIPVFMTSERPFNPRDIHGEIECRIYWTRSKGTYSWSIDAPSFGGHLTFDVPISLLKMYLDENGLSRERALDFKERILDGIQLFYLRNHIPRHTILRLQPGWIDSLRREL